MSDEILSKIFDWTFDSKIASPAYLYGPTGSGKTYMIKEKLIPLCKKSKLTEILNTTEEAFLTSLMDVIKSQNVSDKNDFISTLTKNNLIIIDNFQVSYSRPATLKEVIKVFKALSQKTKLLVVSTSPPSAELLKIIESDLIFNY